MCIAYEVFEVGSTIYDAGDLLITGVNYLRGKASGAELSSTAAGAGAGIFGFGGGYRRAGRAALRAGDWAPTAFHAEELDKHFAKHAAEWGAGNITRGTYLNPARSLLSKQSGGDILEHTRANGDVLRYNARTNEFAVGTADGARLPALGSADVAVVQPDALGQLGLAEALLKSSSGTGAPEAGMSFEIRSQGERDDRARVSHRKHRH